MFKNKIRIEVTPTRVYGTQYPYRDVPSKRKRRRLPGTHSEQDLFTSTITESILVSWCTLHTQVQVVR